MIRKVHIFFNTCHKKCSMIFSENIKQAVLDFVILYINEPNQKKKFKDFHMILQNTIISSEFAQFLQYIGQNPLSNFNTEPVNIKLFKAFSTKHNILI